MVENFEINVQSPTESSPCSLQLPLNFLTIGKTEHDDIKVYIKQDIYKNLEKLALSDTAKELGSILLGEYTEESGKINVVISEYIEAKYTDASASTLTFTHETWDYIHSEHSKNYPGLKILGWQHTHPDYGIFLSNYDLFIQENFFNLPFQVAYVIDPVQQTRGFFQWKNGKVQKLTGFYVYDDIGKPVKIKQSGKEKKKSSPFSKLTVSLLCLLVAVSAVFAAAFINLNSKFKNEEAKQSDYQAQIKSKNDTISAQSESLKELQQALTAQTASGADADSIEELINKLESNEASPANTKELIQELKSFASSLNSGGENNKISFKAVTVKSGDTLFGLCKENNINFEATVKIIKTINGIEDINIITPGQTLLLPVTE